MNNHSARTIYRIPPSLSNREYREPHLITIPKGKGEEWESLCNSIRKRNQWVLHPDGQD